MKKSYSRANLKVYSFIFIEVDIKHYKFWSFQLYNMIQYLYILQNEHHSKFG